MEVWQWRNLRKKKDKVKTKFTFNSVKTKLILYFSILILISSLTTGIVGLRASKAAIIRATEESLVSLAYDGAKLTKSNIEKELRTIELISHRKEIQSMDLEIQLPALEDELKWTNFIDMGVVDLGECILYRWKYCQIRGQRLHKASISWRF